VIAVDVNPAQSALIELKRAAVRTTPEAVAAFVGAMPASLGPDPSRLDPYGQLRPGRSAAAAHYWDAHADEIVAGVVHAGRFERYLALFRRVVAGRRSRVVRQMLAAENVEERADLPRGLGLRPGAGYSVPSPPADGRDRSSSSLLRAGTGVDVGHFLARAVDGPGDADPRQPVRDHPELSYRFPMWRGTFARRTWRCSPTGLTASRSDLLASTSFASCPTARSTRSALRHLRAADLPSMRGLEIAGAGTRRALCY
jgi:hypothetical protein